MNTLTIHQELNRIILDANENQHIQITAQNHPSLRFTNRLNITIEMGLEILYKMRYTLELSTISMAEYFLISRQGIHKILKKLGWEYTRKEAMINASKKRNYQDIRLKAKKTMFDKGNVTSESLNEMYIREEVNALLSKKFSTDVVIVGLNNLSILKSGQECDIPIIIARENQVFKYVLEPGADYWHKDNDELDNKKATDLSDKGYKLLVLSLTNKNQSIKSKALKKDIDNIVTYIVEDVLNSSYSKKIVV